MIKLKKISKAFLRIKKDFLKRIFLMVLIFIFGILLGYSYFKNQKNPTSLTTQDKYSAFISEVYDKVQGNFWDNIADTQLLDQFSLSIEKNTGNPIGSKFDSKDKMLQGFKDSISSLPDDQKQKITPQIAASVLTSLSPLGRSGLYTQKQEEQLKNTVENVNPEKDLYKDLGLSKGANSDQIASAYQNLSKNLSKQSSPEAQQKLKEISYAKDVLTNQDQKKNYDSAKIEPTIFTKVVSSGILYYQFKKFSPTSYDEFRKAFDKYKDDSFYGLIFDLRGNVGGAIDATSYFLGNFLGKGQYAFDFYHKGDYQPFKTQTDKLALIGKYKQIVILIDNSTQSSAEMMAAALKKYHLGVLVGVPTKGWGTVERVFPLDHQISEKEKYSVFLVHSITLRDDNQPIEGRGVDPDVSIKDGNWENKLYSYFRNQSLVDGVKSVL